jgi:glycosyltransferase involved in cell wall biosynthesis
MAETTIEGLKTISKKRPTANPRLLILLNPSIGAYGVLTKDLPLILKHVNPQEYEIELVAGVTSVPVLENNGFKVNEIPLSTRSSKGLGLFIGYLLYMLLLFFCTIRTAKRFSPDYLFSITGHAYSGLATTIAGKILRIRTIVRISEPTSSSIGFKYTCGSILKAVLSIEELWVLRNCDIPLSNRNLEGSYPRDITSRITVLSQGVDETIFQPRKALWQPDKSNVCLISIARLSAEKNLDSFLHAFNICRRTFPQMRAIIIGEGPLKENLQQLTMKLGIAANIEFLGYVGSASKVAGLLTSCDVFVLSSTVEGLPSVMLEAMACKIPVVTVASWGIEATDFENGVHVHICERSPASIANSVVSLLNDHEKTQRMIDRAYELVMERHTFKSCRRLFKTLIHTS